MIAHRGTQIMVFNMARKDGMGHPFIAYSLRIRLHAKSNGFPFVFGPLVHNGTLSAIKGTTIGIRFPEILPHFWPNGFQKITKVTYDRVIPQNSMLCLQAVINSQNHQWKWYSQQP